MPVLVALGGPDAAFLGMAALAPLAVLVTIRRVRHIDREADIPVVELGLLRSMHLFSALPAGPLETSPEARYLDVPAGAAVIREGEEGDRYYAITDGEVAVTKAALRRSGTMRRGEGFGEIALLHKREPHREVTATRSRPDFEHRPRTRSSSR